VSAVVRVGAAFVGGLAGAHLLPSVLTVPALHRRVAPRLSGRSDRTHVALTFDDGPDPQSTPLFLETLERLQVSATFFLLGSEVERHPEVARRVVHSGHEVAVHGWAHVPHLLRSPWAVWADLDRACRQIVGVTGVRPAYWRPPNGVLSGAGLGAAHRLGLQPVLWTADGQDWHADATAPTVADRVMGQLARGGTVLLHDSDITSASGSWRTTLAAVPSVVEKCRARGWQVGPLREHWAEDREAAMAGVHG
jgi:peptidoglycan/xylan/chitin deacetylase (PgdA/CDA1 family)